MNILVTGSYGFIGGQITADLIAAGHRVIGCGRHYGSDFIFADFRYEISEIEWEQKLHAFPQIDVIVNCIGVLQAKENNMWNIHYHTPKNLILAASKKGLRQVIQISALGIENVNVPFANSKKALDAFLLTLPIDVMVLRPSLTYGKGSYGGTSLFRGLAGLPGFIPVLPEESTLFQPISVYDLSHAVVKLLKQPGKKILNAVGPNRLALWEVLTQLRSWLGFEKALKITIPRWLVKGWFKIGDFLSVTANSTLYKMMVHPNIASETETRHFMEIVGFTPKRFTDVLQQNPSTVQDHWHARLYFLRPLLRLSLAFLWIFSGINALFQTPMSQDLLFQIGIENSLGILYSASVLDIMLGLATLFNYKLKWIGAAQILLSIIYTVIISIKLPSLWFDPFGSITKNIPIIIATAMMMAMESKR